MSEKLKELRALDMAFEQAKNHLELSQSVLPQLGDQAYRQILGLQSKFNEGQDALKAAFDGLLELRNTLESKEASLPTLESKRSDARVALANFVEANGDVDDQRFQSTLSQAKRKLDNE
jgi:hypothetical protein